MLVEAEAVLMSAPAREEQAALVVAVMVAIRVITRLMGLLIPVVAVVEPHKVQRLVQAAPVLSSSNI
jgi:hypothetical protein